MAEIGLEDWFAEGVDPHQSLIAGLQAVHTKLSIRQVFIKKLMHKFFSTKASSGDALTYIRLQLRCLDQTLANRMPMLSPTRPGAWFRPFQGRSLGPFPVELFQQPVLDRYQPSSVESVKGEIRTNFAGRQTGGRFISDAGSSLWGILLKLNRSLEEICVLDAPFSGLRMETLEAQLPKELCSPGVHVFLHNVSQTIGQCRGLLDRSYTYLWQHCQPFWSIQVKIKDQQAGGGGGARDRATTFSNGAILSAMDIKSLQFMDFETIPDKIQLKRRYLHLAQRLHPDRQGGNEESFKLLNASYGHLAAKVGKN